MTRPRYGRHVPGSDHVGVLIIRVWSESVGDPTALRARITESIDVDTDERTVATVADTDGICAEVRAWIDRYLGQAGA